MSPPKHLWSGDWESESAAAARERARRQAALPQPKPEPEPPEPPAEPRRAAVPPRAERPAPQRPAPERPTPPRPAAASPAPKRRERTWTAPKLRTAPVVLAAAVLLILAAGAYGLSTLGGSDHKAAPAHVAWLGADMQTLPINRVIITAVTPGSPADRVGLGPGDLITAINNQPVSSPGDVSTTIAHLQPGDAINLRIQRGPLTYSTRATLAQRPSNLQTP
jgi:hypothetical protein